VSPASESKPASEAAREPSVSRQRAWIQRVVRSGREQLIKETTPPPKPSPALSKRSASPRTHFIKKNQTPPKHGMGPSFPALGLGRPEQKGWTGFEPEVPKLLSDLKQKKRRPAVSPFEMAGSWPKRAGWRPRSAECFSQRLIGRQLFPRA
jgi:hypothetical protein